MKYQQGEVISTMEDLIREMGMGRLIFLRDQPKHPSFITHMTFDTVLQFLNGGQLYKARKIEPATTLPSFEEREASRIRLMNPIQRLGYWLGFTWRVLIGKEVL